MRIQVSSAGITKSVDYGNNREVSFSDVVTEVNSLLKAFFPWEMASSTLGLIPNSDRSMDRSNENLYATTTRIPVPGRSVGIEAPLDEQVRLTPSPRR